jgi:hypothetical protein
MCIRGRGRFSRRCCLRRDHCAGPAFGAYSSGSMVGPPRGPRPSPGHPPARAPLRGALAPSRPGVLDRRRHHASFGHRGRHGGLQRAPRRPARAPPLSGRREPRAPLRDERRGRDRARAHEPAGHVGCARGSGLGGGRVARVLVRGHPGGRGRQRGSHPGLRGLGRLLRGLPGADGGRSGIPLRGGRSREPDRGGAQPRALADRPRRRSGDRRTNDHRRGRAGHGGRRRAAGDALSAGRGHVDPPRVQLAEHGAPGPGVGRGGASRAGPDRGGGPDGAEPDRAPSRGGAPRVEPGRGHHGGAPEGVDRGRPARRTRHPDGRVGRAAPGGVGQRRQPHGRAARRACKRPPCAPRWGRAACG